MHTNTYAIVLTYKAMTQNVSNKTSMMLKPVLSKVSKKKLLKMLAVVLFWVMGLKVYLSYLIFSVVSKF